MVAVAVDSEAFGWSVEEEEVGFAVEAEDMPEELVAVEES